MKKIFISLSIVASLLMTSCFSTIHTYGKGPQEGQRFKEKNHYFLAGLIPGNTSNPQKMAGGAKDFEVKTSFQPIDYVLTIITLGIYSPSTTVVQK